MRLNVEARLFEIECRQCCVVRTGASYEYVVHRRRQVIEESVEQLEVGRIEGGSALRLDLGRSALETLAISAREEHIGSLSARLSRSLESDPGATSNHDDGLPQKSHFALAQRLGRCGAHDVVSAYEVY